MNGLALYAGYAGLDIGLQLAEPSYRTVCYVEREASCAANLVARMEAQELHQAPIWDDSGTFDGNPWRGTVDIITAGFPCPEVSVAGKRKGIEGERWLWGDVARIIREVQPQRLLLENVRGLLSANDGGAHSQVLGDLAEIGFDVWWGSVPASRLGARHSRDRLFYVANSHSQQRKGRGKSGHQTGREEPTGSIALCRGTMGDTKSPNRWGEQQPCPTKRRWSGSTGTSSTLGNSDGSGRKIWNGRQGEPGPYNRSERSSIQLGNPTRICEGERECRSGQFPNRGSSQALGNSNCERCGETGQCLTDREQFTDWYGGGLPFSPPGPNADREWYEIAQFAPKAQPAVYGVADGSSKRVDRLRMCGNGVYPMAAAWAWMVGQAALAAAAEMDGEMNT